MTNGLRGFKIVSASQRTMGDKKTPATTFVVITGAKVEAIRMRIK
jgi:hypothetical protein